MKYKLIKEYPGSPPLETIVEEKSKSSSFYHFFGNAVLRNHVENNPDYWQRIEFPKLSKQKAIKIFNEMEKCIDTQQMALVAVDEILSWNQTKFWEDVKQKIKKL
jgi:hypothetical protein